MTDADLLRENGRLRKRVEELERERRIDKDTIQHHALVICNARNDALEEAEKRISAIWVPGQRNLLGDVLRALKTQEAKP